MKYFTKIASAFILILMGFCSCRSQTIGGHPSECIKLNDEGVDSLMHYYGYNKSALDKAIDLFKQAIQCDSTNVVFYTSLGSAYHAKHNDIGEMAMLNKILKLTNDDPNILFQKGMLYERMGNLHSANLTYDIVQKEFAERLNKNPEDIELIKANTELKAIVIGKKEALNYLADQIKLHPKISTQLTPWIDFYQDFDRHSFVFGLPVVKDLPLNKN